jgi:hypothetical protein
MRMGISSLEDQAIVEGCMDKGLDGKRRGHVVYKLSTAKRISASKKRDHAGSRQGLGRSCGNVQRREVKWHRTSLTKNVDMEEILKDLDKYAPRRKGWTWRKKDPA